MTLIDVCQFEWRHDWADVWREPFERTWRDAFASNDDPAVVFACSDPIARRARFWFDAAAARDGEAAVEPWKGRGYGPWLAACALGTQTVSETDARALMTSEEHGILSRQPGIEIGGTRRGIRFLRTPRPPCSARRFSIIAPRWKRGPDGRCARLRTPTAGRASTTTAKR